MKKLLFIIVYVSSGTFQLSGQQPTILGIHGTSNPNALGNLGAKVARYGFTDYQLKNIIDNGDTTFLNKMIQLNSMGIEQVVFLRFPEDTVENVGATYERIPTGIDCIEVFQYLDSLLTVGGPYIDWIQINQEPQSKTPYNNTIYSPTQILNWWRTLATFIRTRINNNPSQLEHLKIIAPGLIVKDGALTDTNNQSIAEIDSIIKFGEEYCDAVDIHLNTYSVAKGIQQIQYVQDRTSHPLAATEWSQYKIAYETGWLDSINTVWTNPSDPLYGLTNWQVIGTAYDKPISISDWNNLIATSPYTENFIPDFYAVLDSNCFLFACYAACFQYGHPGFDWRALFTNRVTQNVYPNQPFYDEFVNMTAIVNAGAYSTACPFTQVEEFTADRKYEVNDLVNIFPNPTNGMINIISADFVKEIIIYDITGKEVANYRGINLTQIKLSENFASGVYILRINTGHKLYAKKLQVIK